MKMTSDLWAGLAMATGLWVLIAAALVSPPATTPSEVWVATSDRVRSHPTLVRAAAPIRSAPVVAKSKGEQVTLLAD
jgi:hypothetical protein